MTISSMRPVFGSLPPRAALQQQNPVPLPVPPLPAPQPVENNPAVIPNILDNIQRLVQQRGRQDVRFGMDAQRPQEPDQIPVEAEEPNPPGTPEGQRIPLVVPNAPRPNWRQQFQPVRPGVARRLFPDLPPLNLNDLPLFEQVAQPQPPDQAAPPLQSPSNQSEQTRVGFHSPAKSVNSKK